MLREREHDNIRSKINNKVVFETSKTLVWPIIHQVRYEINSYMMMDFVLSFVVFLLTQEVGCGFRIPYCIKNFRKSLNNSRRIPDGVKNVNFQIGRKTFLSRRFFFLTEGSVLLLEIEYIYKKRSSGWWLVVWVG